MKCKFYINISGIDPYYVEVDTEQYYISVTQPDNYYVEVKTCEDVLSGIGYWIIESTFIIQ